MPDTYQKWERSGQLDEKLEGIRELVSKRVSEGKIAEYLGISQKTLIRLKKVYPKVNAAIDKGREDLRHELIDSIYKSAVGFTIEKVTSTIEETKAGTRKRVVKEAIYHKPETKAAIYLLTLTFGDEYHERKREIDLMEQRLNAGDEVWISDKGEVAVVEPEYKRSKKEKK